MTSLSNLRGRGSPSLQARLMITIIGVVALILSIIGLATAAILGGILQENLNAKVTTAQQQVGRAFAQLPLAVALSDVTATDLLEQGRQQPGTVLVLRTAQVTGAFISDDARVVSLTPDQVAGIIDSASTAEQGSVAVEGLGEYRIGVFQFGAVVGVVGLPLSDVNATIRTMLTTVLLVTTVGLLTLAVVIAIVIRASLRPLRSVAEIATRVSALPLGEGEVSIAERVPPDESDENTEIGQVGAALNTLLDHVDASLHVRQLNEERMRRFVADASHELRTPLASIRGYSELSLRALRHGSAPGVVEDTQSSLERIQVQSLRMSALIEDLLLLTRIDEGQEIVFATVDLTQLAVEAVHDARPAARDHQWQLEIGSEPIVVAGDASRLHQVVANLLANAAAHTPESTTVTVSLSRDAGDAVLRVRDDGPGVDPAVADELFERFSRGDRSRARHTGGSGLGLSIARAIVLAHNGTLTVRSRPGDTVFEMRIPARPHDPDHSDDQPVDVVRR